MKFTAAKRYLGYSTVLAIISFVSFAAADSEFKFNSHTAKVSVSDKGPATLVITDGATKKEYVESQDNAAFTQDLFKKGLLIRQQIEIANNTNSNLTLTEKKLDTGKHKPDANGYKQKEYYKALWLASDETGVGIKPESLHASEGMNPDDHNVVNYYIDGEWVYGEHFNSEEQAILAAKTFRQNLVKDKANANRTVRFKFEDGNPHLSLVDATDLEAKVLPNTPEVKALQDKIAKLKSQFIYAVAVREQMSIPGKKYKDKIKSNGFILNAQQELASANEELYVLSKKLNAAPEFNNPSGFTPASNH